ncbi:MAG: hypothetical protein KC910_11720 [Candidatus Eremiobacteraeota bacterium]|nr:hypothetical protein [Candidatus Eremiobacteraeota bacterium]
MRPVILVLVLLFLSPPVVADSGFGLLQCVRKQNRDTSAATPSQAVLALIDSYKNAPSTADINSIPDSKVRAKFKEMLEQNYQIMKPHLSRGQQKRMKSELKSAKVEGLEAMAMVFLAAYWEDLRNSSPKIVSEKVKGKTATVVVEILKTTELSSGKKEPSRATVKLVKESSQWKVDSELGFDPVKR